MLLKIKTENDKTFWIQEFNQWFSRHKEYINEKTFNQETDRYCGTLINYSDALILP